jgi:hypothetical protein
MLTVKLLRPELSSPEWQDAEGKNTEKGYVGEALKLKVSCNEDTEEGAGVTFRVYAAGAEPGRDAPVAELSGKNQGGTAEAEWTYRYKKPKTEVDQILVKYLSRILGAPVTGDFIGNYISDLSEPREGEIQDTRKYIFTAVTNRSKVQKSAEIELTDSLQLFYVNAFGERIANSSIVINNPLGEEKNTSFDDNGTYGETDLMSGIYNLSIKREAEK